MKMKLPFACETPFTTRRLFTAVWSDRSSTGPVSVSMQFYYSFLFTVKQQFLEDDFSDERRRAVLLGRRCQQR